MNAPQSAHRRNSWIAGAILILLGIIFLLQNFTRFSLNNWWALFILIPAFGSFDKARRAYHAAGGEIDYVARNSIIWGVLFTLLTAILLFNLSWSLFLPLILILIGLTLLITYRVR
jgi:hypothetical protein